MCFLVAKTKASISRSITPKCTDNEHSRSIRERTEHITRAADAGTLELPIHLQSTVQLPGH